MTTSFHFGHLAGLAALLSTTAMPLSAVAAATASQTDEGVSMAISGADAIAPTLKMMRRGDMAGERFATGPFEVIQLLLSDATTLTLAEKTDLSVDHYVYNKGHRRGELIVTLERGILKVIGGALNNTTPIIINTPGGEIAIDNATAVIVVEEDGSVKTALDYGNGVTLTANDGRVSKIVKPGFEVAVASDGDVSGPYRRPAGDALKIARALNPGLVTGVVPVAEIETTEPVETVALVEEEQEEVATAEEVIEQEDPTVAEVDVDLTETGVEPAQFDGDGAGGALVQPGAFDAGTVVLEIATADTPPSQSTGAIRTLTQGRKPELVTGVTKESLSDPEIPPTSGTRQHVDEQRPFGLTANKIINSDENLTLDLSSNEEPKAALVPLFDGQTDKLQYTFYSGDGAARVAVVPADQTLSLGGFLFEDSIGFSAALIADTFENLAESDGKTTSKIKIRRFTQSDPELTIVPVNDPGTIFGDGIVSALQSGFRIVDVQNLEGTLFEDFSDILNDPDLGGADRVVDRREDNFIVFHVKPAIVTETGLSRVRDRFTSVDQIRNNPDARIEFLETLNPLVIDAGEGLSEEEIFIIAVEIAEAVFSAESIDDLKNVDASLEEFL